MPKSLITSGLPNIPSGFPDQQARLLTPIYLAINGLADKVSAATGLTDYADVNLAQINQLEAVLTQRATRIFLKATVAIAYGKLCNMHLDSGKLSARLADSTNDTLPACCICNQPFGLGAGEYGEFLMYSGYTQGIGSTAVGQTYYLGTNGDSQSVRPAAAGSIIQAVGIGLGSAGFYLQISPLFIKN